MFAGLMQSLHVSCSTRPGRSVADGELPEEPERRTRRTRASRRDKDSNRYYAKMRRYVLINP